MTADLSSSTALGVNTVGFLRRLGVEAEFPEGEIIIQRGQEGNAFYVLLMGEVEVRINHGDGTSLPLGRLHAGATFGELSALRRTPAIADVVARTPVRLLVYPAEHLAQALGECEPLRRKVMANLAYNLQRTTASTWALFKHAKVLSSREDGREVSELVGASARMRSIRLQIASLCESNAPVLIVGARGTGKLLAARAIHHGSSRAEGPLIEVDCSQLPRSKAVEPLLGSALHAESEYVKGLGAIHLAHGGSFILRNLDGLDPQDQQLLAHYSELQKNPERHLFPDIRLMATARDAERLTSHVQALFEQKIELPPLAQRRRDILPLANHFLHELRPEKSLGTSAEHALLARSYQQRNVAELKEVVGLAAHCAEGAVLETEHIFSSISSDAGSIGWLLPFQERLRRLIRGGWLAAIRMLVLVGLVAVVGLCLGNADALAGRAANGLIWRAWEPIVFASFFLVGSIWCAICPLSTAGRLMKRLIALRLPAPAWLRPIGPWIAALGFLLIVSIEMRFDALVNPLASGLLLLGLLVSSVVCCVIFQREIWCRDLCPLGRLAEVLAPAAPLTIAARRSVCSSSCVTHECFKGADRMVGCTVFHHPQQVNEAHRCKMCLDCLATCPHEAVGLHLRPPLHGVFKLDGTAIRLIPFALGVEFLAVVLLASQGERWQALDLTAATLPALFGGLMLGIALQLLLRRIGDQRQAAPRLALSLSILGWGALMAYQLEHIPMLGALNLTIVPGSWEERVLPAAAPLSSFLKLGVVLGAASAAVVSIFGACKQTVAEGGRTRPALWLSAVLVCLVITVIILASLLPFR